MMRFLRLFLALVLAIAGPLFLGFVSARADPVVRLATIALPHWPRGAPPVRVALLGDIHIGSAAMGPRRLDRIVDRVNALHPDLVLIAGDFIDGRGRAKAANAPLLVAPLRRLRAPLGMVAVLGNHDYWTDPGAVTRAVEAAGGTMLVNRAVERGPLAIAGIDDGFTRHESIPPTMAQLRRLPGARVVLTHSPDVARELPGDAPFLLAAHTHCGQVVLPWIGPLASVIRDRRLTCGLVRGRGRVTIVTGGVGTSQVPIRIGAPPDLWLLTLGPPR